MSDAQVKVRWMKRDM